MSTRDTYKYQFFSARRKLLHCGRTRRLHDREAEHRRDFKEPNGYIVQVGNITTWEAAGEWEKANRC
jgi:hypothetical protein